MAITSKPLEPPARRGVGHAPVNRAHLDKAAPWLRAGAGLALIAYTSYTTITGIQTDFAPLLENAPQYVALGAGLGAAALLSLGQWLTSESVPFVYFILLLIDARYTQRQNGPWIDALAQYHLQASPALLTTGVSLIVSWGLSIAAARYGEILLFGRRKPKKED